jgi:hypothetical protein
MTADYTGFLFRFASARLLSAFFPAVEIGLLLHCELVNA